MSSEVKPGPCPACGCADREVFIIVPGESIKCAPCGFTTRYVEVWNRIRARALREAAEIGKRAVVDDCETQCDEYSRNGCVHEGAQIVTAALAQAAARAERGEP